MTWLSRRLLSVLLISLRGCMAALSQERPAEFIKDIRPVFEAACYQCHGSKLQMAELRLDSKELAYRGGISGRVIIPGKSSESLLMQRVLGTEGKIRMPLQGPPLTTLQVDLIRKWIDEGANWPDDASATNTKVTRHWAYIKPVRPILPNVKNSAWVRNPIDRFVLARLEREGLTPSPEASPETLIRRVSLDLIGLPPTLEEVDAFVADKSPDAFEKAVDRLLSSSHYGERWARPWLDLARYADTNGFADNRRTIWKYRDWVIAALNKDMPFDQFTIEQIAGDMLPQGTLEQKIATGFHRNTMFNDEGGVDQDEARWINNVDRAGTTATVWLGTTLACAQCHNHKYDPFTQKDFYGLLAFFENGDYRLEGEGRHQLYIEPVLELPTPQQEIQRNKLRAQIADIEKLPNTATPELQQAQALWESEDAPVQARWHILTPTEYTSSGGASFKKAEGDVLLVTPNLNTETYTVVVRTDLKAITAFQLEALPSKVISRLRVQAGLNGSAVIDIPGPQSSQTGPSYWVAPEAVTSLQERNQLTLVFTVEHPDKSVRQFRLSASGTRGAAPGTPLPDRIRAILDVSVEKRSRDQTEALATYYRSIAPLLKPQRDRLAELTDQLAKLPIVTTLVMRERLTPGQPSTNLRIRGSYLNKGETVLAGTPAALPPLDKAVPINRFGLANWLVNEDNPLVARVTVNRFWEQIFGIGMVETAEDFGSRGERPSHPELLDWLATEFLRCQWSMKSIHRLIVTSATYRQSARITPALQERDPHNRLLARGPRFRMEAEMIRDSALAASGLLNRTIGGPPVFPFQPEGVWNQPYYKDLQWMNAEGENRYRRGIYTFWRRTAPYPSFVSFDAPSREFCVVRRIRTNTPLQALTTLNDPAFFEAAKGLARRILNEAVRDTQARAEYGFRLCLARWPNAKELDQIVSLYRHQWEHFRADRQAAIEVTGNPGQEDISDLAAWTVVSNVLLNLDETLTKE